MKVNASWLLFLLQNCYQFLDKQKISAFLNQFQDKILKPSFQTFKGNPALSRQLHPVCIFEPILLRFFQLTLTFSLYLIKIMSNRFEYNFTRQSQYQELRQKVSELQQQNTMLKQSLEELIKVNTQLTESIEELTNSNNMNSNNEELEGKFQMLINENHNLRQELESEKYNNKSQKQGIKIQDQDQTQSLVNVLEELIQSFKNIQMKYESQIKDLQEQLKNNVFQFEQKIKKIQEQLQSKIGTIQAISTQLKHKDEALLHITNKLNQLEKQTMLNQNSIKIMKPQSNEQIKNLEKKIEKVNKDLEEKQKVIRLYEGLFNNLKGKIMEKI